VPDLSAYQSNLLRINQADLPPEYQFDRDEFAIAPPTRGGALIEYSVRPVHISRGRIVLGADRQAPPVAYGSLRVNTPGGPFTSLLGSNGEFELDALPPGRWSGEAESDAGQCEVLLDVPMTNAPVQYLGTFACLPRTEAPAGAAP
jgi:outer membrane usher protein FimD/PapC